ncbi:SGNH/GDSL hydrolase family protein [Mesonia aestuariivivens]|uniref:GDSL family lipase n=1 Tax=Mesonia aestuariivivens TaxID=2796128 RepID=A0ABS6W4G0_9FLAO|nr:SGNH/GDSL hydrolase family protein [Mesonia aestuariivivens]MBW2962740.1 GDSL family lipase [Mesonia aestuariivivens]
MSIFQLKISIMYYRLFYLLLFVAFSSCKQSEKTSARKEIHTYQSTDSVFNYSGRVLEDSSNHSAELISAASSVQFQASGDKLDLHLKAVAPHHAFAVVEVDGNYMNRYQVAGDSVSTISIPLKKEGFQKIKIFKATEASTGKLFFIDAKADTLKAFSEKKDFKIEFIGNSITSGMGDDESDLPCGEGEWYDQHNAYWAYGPRVARALNAEYMLSSVSGMGMYRNWNDEDQPVMPDVYQTLSLDGDTTRLRDFKKFQPDLISICLGTNDLSDGDGEKEREAFSQKKYEENYTKFIESLYEKFPSVKIALLTSPMIDPTSEKGKLLESSLKAIKAKFERNHTIALYEFEKMNPTGCGHHPSIEGHTVMAENLIPFYKELLNQ